jgi:ATP/maltotriose-dependent transcriptional regulator MalT
MRNFQTYVEKQTFINEGIFDFFKAKQKPDIAKDWASQQLANKHQQSMQKVSKVPHPLDIAKHSELNKLNMQWNNTFPHSNDPKERAQIWQTIQNMSQYPTEMKKYIDLGNEILHLSQQPTQNGEPTDTDTHHVQQIVKLLSSRYEEPVELGDEDEMPSKKPLHYIKNHKARKAQAEELRQQGLSDQEIADELAVTLKTVKGYFKTGIKGLVGQDGSYTKLNVRRPIAASPQNNMLNFGD